MPMQLSFAPDGGVLAVAESHYSRGPEVQFWDELSSELVWREADRDILYT